ncbi:hypothetical protein CRUP_032903 [Coryphaenoides rupestris]|nr:hypothetical protein CRUP_032903 [Coryphaenoides rupestris]
MDTRDRTGQDRTHGRDGTGRGAALATLSPGFCIPRVATVNTLTRPPCRVSRSRLPVLSAVSPGDLLDERTAVVEGYNSYFSFSRGRSGYSGVATYCKDSAAPFAAEEGLTSLLVPREEAVGCYGDPEEFSAEELLLLDNEGRAVITQHRYMCEGQIQKITVVNVYCPRADPEKPERKQFKLQFYKLLQSRAEALLKAGSHVIILGDVNTSHRTIDHCDPSDLDDFDEHPGRKWLNVFLHDDGKHESGGESEEDASPGGAVRVHVHGGKFVDTFRYFHPTRTHAFTCWNTMTGARQTNYGTRIDYIFADVPLAREQFSAADIMPEVEGSDHCPVWAELRCTLLASPKLPPLCTRFLPEFAGKQQKLSHFLVKVEPKAPLNASESRDSLPSSQEAGEKRENLKPLGAAAGGLGKKRPLGAGGLGAPKGKKTKMTKTSAKPPAPQGSLLAFFKPKTSVGAPVVKASAAPSADDTTPTPLPSSGQSEPAARNTHDKDSSATSTHTSSSAMEECNGTTLRELAAERPTAGSTGGPPQGPKKGPSSLPGFWKSVLHGPPPPPPCKGHREPCVLRTVKKEGPNMGRQFFVCCRPQGHASNPEARCNFFAWVDKGK